MPRCPCLIAEHAQANGSELVWASSANGPPQLDPRGSYKLPEGGFASMGPTVSPVALSKFLTATSGKQFQNPPSEMLASRGLFIHDLLELFSGKPMPGRVRLSALPCCLSFVAFHFQTAPVAAISSEILAINAFCLRCQPVDDSLMSLRFFSSLLIHNS